MKVDLISDSDLSLVLDTKDGIIEAEGLYEISHDTESNTTLISAQGMLHTGESYVLKLGYDKKENANGDLIITKPSIGNEFPEETFIHFNNNEWISLENMHEIIEKNSQGLVMPMADNLPYVKSAKYGKYTFSNVQWNTNNLVSNNDNNLQIKFQPLFSSINTWKDPYGRTGQLIKKQSGIYTLLTRYESYTTTSPYAIAYTYPIVKETTKTTIPITISYAGIGSEIQIPIGSDNKKTDGNPARWDLSNINIPLQDSSGRDLDKYTIQGITKITGKGANVKIQAGVYVKIGAFYSFYDKPAQWTTFTDTYNHDITAKVQ
ncbi:hypothetical protein BBD41_13140 [Paenibacillus ihbetae]|uniref:Uncharacterized protein n=1 Tax=Paenibacillus ihbetae TaxID=1870820 RepID=A0A1B2E0K3_9BACL|nr:hypothetical protein [Paenibacillus ihbetae]ANY73452.1 hypothetical protein BBD41_13140 [Paenibacillus ihbetae]